MEVEFLRNIVTLYQIKWHHILGDGNFWTLNSSNYSRIKSANEQRNTQAQAKFNKHGKGVKVRLQKKSRQLDLTEVRPRENKASFQLSGSLFASAFSSSFIYQWLVYFPPVQSKCPPHFLSDANGRYPQVIYLSAWVHSPTPNGDSLR
jgi:hypothetical protein